MPHPQSVVTRDIDPQNGKPIDILWVTMYPEGKKTVYRMDTCDPTTQYWDGRNRKRWMLGPFPDEVEDLYAKVGDEDDAADEQEQEKDDIWYEFYNMLGIDDETLWKQTEVELRRKEEETEEFYHRIQECMGDESSRAQEFDDIIETAELLREADVFFAGI